MSILCIENLRASIDDKEILKGLNLSVGAGSIHVVMGPNGVGKSTFGHIIMGNKRYTRTAGKVFFNGEELSTLNTSEIARKGIFLGFQYPVAIPGLRLNEYLRNLYTLHHGSIGVTEFRKILRAEMDALQIDRTVTQRFLNDGFSGGEMKRLEMLQLALIRPKLAILDEIDSGVDLDAQKIIAESIRSMTQRFQTAFILITHYERLLNLLEPDYVHVLLDGRIVHTGKKEVLATLSTHGYEAFRV